MSKKTFNPISAEQRKHLFWLFKQIGLDEETRNEMINEWTEGRASRMSELGFIDAMNIIRYIKSLSQTPQKRKTTADPTLDKKRKGLIKAIFAYFENQGREVTMKYVIQTACRAGGVARLNDLTEADLQRLYAEFCRKQTAQITINKNNKYNFPNN
jgi:hypothetical protein